MLLPVACFACRWLLSPHFSPGKVFAIGLFISCFLLFGRRCLEWKRRRFFYVQQADSSFDSYEALPANYGLGRNMLAGAFAGIAVCFVY